MNPSYLLSNLDEINLLADSMENRLGLRYTTQLINCHRYQNNYDALCRSTVNVYFFRLKPKITRIQKFNMVLRMRVSGKKQDNAKQNNG